MERIDDKTNIKSIESRRGKVLWVKTPHKDAAEFTDLRYTAVECPEPIEFDKWGYQMRCTENGRSLKVYLVVTMYAEDDKELDSTLRGICENIKNFPEYKDIALPWQEIAVCAVNDGRLKANKKMLEYAESCGFYDQEIMLKYGNPGDKDWRATWDTYMHLFEFSAQLKEDDNFEKCYPPVQIQFSLKERNGGKLSSHLWFFNAYAQHLNPKYTFLLDVGTIARPRAICKLYQTFERNPQVAGVCGEIAVFKPDYMNPVEASQHFEYKMSHILDKSTESIFGYISVLPGAFSAYRFEAIRPGSDGTGPLVDYFKSITASMKDLGPFKANMYLAEDRILCYEIVARADCNWILRYCKNAVAETDVPNRLHDLIKQRRRWLNGSFFAMLYAVLNFNRLWTRSSHSLGRKLVITLQFVTYVLQIFLNWFLIGTFYLGFIMVMDQALQNVAGSPKRFGYVGGKKIACDYRGAESLTFICSYTYAFLTLVQLICALGNKPDKVPGMYAVCALFYGIFTLFTVVVVGFILADGENPAWKCEARPGIVSCNKKDECVPGNIVEIQRGSAGTDVCSLIASTDESVDPALECLKGDQVGESWKCICNEDQVGMSRFSDCQTLCETAPIHPEQLRWFTAGSFASYFVGGLLHGEIKNVLFSFVQYFAMLPTFINIFSIYSYCNVHDISWGTKGIEAAHGPSDGKKIKGPNQSGDRKRGDTMQIEADAKQILVQQKRELSKAKADSAEKAEIQANFASFRSYLVISWIASNLLYVGILEGFLANPESKVAPPHYFVCTEGAHQRMALIAGMGFKGGAWPATDAAGEAALAPGARNPTAQYPPCLAYSPSLNMGEGSYLVNPITPAAQLKDEAKLSGSCQLSSGGPVKRCCMSIDEILLSNPPGMTPSQIYMIGLFVLVIYTLGIKLIGSVIFLIFRKWDDIAASVSNRQRRNFAMQRMQMVHNNTNPLGDAQSLPEAAVEAGWEAQIDPASGRTYYQNVRTEETAWELPEEVRY